MIHNLFDIIENVVRTQPERTALQTPQGLRISYGQLGATIACYATRCSQAGIAKGSHVTLHDVSTTHYLCLVFALSTLGAVYVRASDQDTSDGKSIKVNRVIVGPNSQLRGPDVLALDLAPPTASDTPAAMAVLGFDAPEDICLIMGTSGTTGLRKHLGFSLALIEQKIDDKYQTFGALQKRVLLHIPPTMPMGLQIALLTLKCGGQIILPRSTPASTLALLTDDNVDEIFASPAMYTAWLEHLRTEGIKLRSIQRAVITGSLASKALLRAVQEYICENLINNYGASEVGVIAHARVDQIPQIDGAVGKLVDWIDARIVDSAGRELPWGETGILQFRLKSGRHIAPNIAEADGGAHAPHGWFTPGDIGTVTSDQILCIFGRSTELINAGGNKIAPSAIEQPVMAFLGDSEPVHAFGVPGPNGYDEVVVIVGMRSSHRRDAASSYGKTHYPARFSWAFAESTASDA